MPRKHFDLVVFADLDITVDYAMNYLAPKVGLSWAWDLQQTLRQGPQVENKLKIALNSLDMLIVDSMGVEKIAKDLGLCAQKIFRAPYGIDIEKYPFRQFRNFRKGKLRVYSNRRWEPLYRPHILLEMAQEFSNNGEKIELVLANDGSLRAPLTKKYSELFNNGSCVWRGQVSRQQNIIELQMADFYISVSKSDGSSLSLLEAMAIGTPTVVTDNPANTEWIGEDMSEYLFSGNSGAELARKIQNLALNSTNVQDLCNQSREKILREADWNLIRGQLLARISEAILE